MILYRLKIELKDVQVVLISIVLNETLTSVPPLVEDTHVLDKIKSLL